MTIRHRRLHRVIWPILTVLVLLGLILSLTVRP